MTDRRKFKARPTTYKGVQMRSRLEAGYAMWLDEWYIPWEYEPRAFASSSGQYLPDFLLHKIPLMHGLASARVDVFVEVKPKGWAQYAEDLARRMVIIWESFPDAEWPPLLVVESPGLDPQMIDLSEYASRSRRTTIEWTPLSWAYVHERQTEDDPCLGLTLQLLDVDRPWPDGYWRGPQ